MGILQVHLGIVMQAIFQPLIKWQEIPQGELTRVFIG